jgi:uncharacterized RDD family membrane protein YckC
MQQLNPYAPPAASIDHAVPGQASPMRLASPGQRFINQMIDYLGFLALSFATGIVFGLARVDHSIYEGAGGAVFGVVSMLLYYIVLEALTGRTLGKLVTGTKVVSADGSAPSFGQIVGRNFARFIPFDGFTFFGRKPGLHDAVSRTRVIRTRSA